MAVAGPARRHRRGASGRSWTATRSRRTGSRGDAKSHDRRGARPANAAAAPAPAAASPGREGEARCPERAEIKRPSQRPHATNGQRAEQAEGGCPPGRQAGATSTSCCASPSEKLPQAKGGDAQRRRPGRGQDVRRPHKLRRAGRGRGPHGFASSAIQLRWPAYPQRRGPGGHGEPSGTWRHPPVRTHAMGDKGARAVAVGPAPATGNASRLASVGFSRCRVPLHRCAATLGPPQATAVGPTMIETAIGSLYRSDQAHLVLPQPGVDLGQVGEVLRVSAVPPPAHTDACNTPVVRAGGRLPLGPGMAGAPAAC